MITQNIMSLLRTIFLISLFFTTSSVFAQTNVFGGAGAAGVDYNNLIQQYAKSKKKSFSTGEVKKVGEIIKKDTAFFNEEIIDTMVLDSIYAPYKRVYGQSLFAYKKIDNFTKSRIDQAPDDYVLGIGDEVIISIWGYAEFNDKYKVSSDGSIDIVRVGKIFVKGLSLDQARALIKKKFSRFYDFSNSSLQIELIYSRDITVSIVGEVYEPGTYSMKGFHSVFNAIFAAGGIKEFGSVRNINVIRKGQQVATFDLYHYLLNPAKVKSIYLEDGDFIHVPTYGRVVRVDGEIRRGGLYEIVDGEGVFDLLKYAGGKSARAYVKNVNIKRIVENQEKIFNINLDELRSLNQNYSLNDGDEITLRPIPDELQNFVTVKGAVRIPGDYELTDSMRLSDLIQKAEGILHDAYIERAYLVRVEKDLVKYYNSIDLSKIIDDNNSEQNILLRRFDEVIIFSKYDFVDQDSVLISGAVREPGKFVFGKGMNLKDVLYLSGGLKKEAAISRIEISRVLNFSEELNVYRPSRTIVKVIEVDFDMGVNEKDALFKLQPMDQIYVRTEPSFELHQNVKIVGEVHYPGTYTLITKEDRLEDILKRAGGVTSYAFLDGAKLFRKENNQGIMFIELDELLNGGKSGRKYNYVLKSGDSLFVPKMNNLVALSGGIEYPGIDSLGKINAPYIKGKRARYYVRNYGVGFDKKRNAMRAKTMVQLPSGIVKKTRNFGIFKIYPKVSKGSEVIVPMKPPKIKLPIPTGAKINWERIIGNFGSTMSALATVMVLYQTIQQ